MPTAYSLAWRLLLLAGLTMLAAGILLGVVELSAGSFCGRGFGGPGFLDDTGACQQLRSMFRGPAITLIFASGIPLVGVAWIRTEGQRVGAASATTSDDAP